MAWRGSQATGGRPTWRLPANPEHLKGRAMSRFTLNVELDNAAMNTTPQIAEAVRRCVLPKLEYGTYGGSITDVNGNTVGVFGVDFEPRPATADEAFAVESAAIDGDAEYRAQVEQEQQRESERVRAAAERARKNEARKRAETEQLATFKGERGVTRAPRAPRLSKPSKAQALVDEGLADSLPEARLMLLDMGE
jgi:hypothetical protein